MPFGENVIEKGCLTRPEETCQDRHWERHVSCAAQARPINRTYGRFPDDADAAGAAADHDVSDDDAEAGYV